MYILFEGVDTCGKTTQIELLKEKYPEMLITKEPGATKLGIKIREILLHNPPLSLEAEILLFLADRAEHYREIIAPNTHRLIISDRGFISGIAYALANKSYDFETLVNLNRFALNNQLPDCVILFILDEATLHERLSQKSLDTIEQRGVKYLLEVQETMKNTILRLEIPHLFIDATNDIETIHTQITDFLRRPL